MLTNNLQASKTFYDNKEDFLQLWVHEAFRIIGDRMWDPADVAWLRKQLDERLSSTFGVSFPGLFEEFGEQVSCLLLHNWMNALQSSCCRLLLAAVPHALQCASALAILLYGSLPGMHSTAGCQGSFTSCWCLLQVPPFVNFLRPNMDVPPYEPVRDLSALKDMLGEKLEDYALEPGASALDLVLFK
jgi:hypothetical protein